MFKTTIMNDTMQISVYLSSLLLAISLIFLIL